MRADRLALLAAVASLLESRHTPFALIGATALGVRGVARTTFDIDLLTTDHSVLNPALWQDLRSGGAVVDVRKGDSDDPLAGVVRFDAEGARPVDLVVGRQQWQRAVLERAPVEDILVGPMRVPDAADLIILKLDAGGPQDLWDIHQLLALGNRETLVATVNGRIAELPEELRSLWNSVLGEASVDE